MAKKTEKRVTGTRQWQTAVERAAENGFSMMVEDSGDELFEHGEKNGDGSDTGREASATKGEGAWPEKQEPKTHTGLQPTCFWFPCV